jgi:rhamnosyltransferase
MKLAAVVILYYPNGETITNIESYYDFFDRVFVFDNTDAEPDLKERLKKYPKIVYYHDYQNRGIAERLNAGARLAIAEGYTWLFTLDQDSYFSLSTLGDYLDIFYRFECKSDVAMFGIEHEACKLLQKEVAGPFSEIDHLITSGALVNLRLFDAIGGFDENLFIDLVDVEFSIRAKKAGFRIIKFNGIMFAHNIGRTVKRASIKSLFLLKKQKEIHSATRCYYMIRNSLYIQAKHKNYDRHLMYEYKRCAVDRVWGCLYYARDTWNIIRYIIRAKADFLNKKMGKLEEKPQPHLSDT